MTHDWKRERLGRGYWRYGPYHLRRERSAPYMWIATDMRCATGQYEYATIKEAIAGINELEKEKA